MKTLSENFGNMVFDDRVMKATLSAKVYTSLKHTIDEGAKLDSGVADAVAAAMKEWAIEKVRHIIRIGSSRLRASLPKNTIASFHLHPTVEL